MSWRSTLWRWTEQALWELFGRPTSEMEREQREWEEANPHLPKPGKTTISG